MVYYKEIVRNGTDIKDSWCGATLISTDSVLTAAHCIHTSIATDIMLTAGLHYREWYTDREQRRIVKEIRVHPQYNSVIHTNDIAILRVNTPFIFNKYVQPACLPGPEPEPDDEAIIIGWGRETIDKSDTIKLKHATTDIVDDCDSWWPQVDSSRQICTADAFEGNSVCFGDSGGPLLTQYQEQYVVSGIISFVDKCNTKTTGSYPNVYTRVSAYKGWIKNIIG